VLTYLYIQRMTSPRLLFLVLVALLPCLDFPLWNTAFAHALDDPYSSSYSTSETTYYSSPTTRKLLAKCSRSRNKRYYGNRYLLEEIDITGKNKDSSCCWYCSVTCGCRKWDYVRDGNTETCRLYEAKARWKKFRKNQVCSSGGTCVHYSGRVKK